LAAASLHIGAVQEVHQRPRPRIAFRPIPLSNLDPDAVKVVRRLVRHHERAYLVGGCVRDLLLGYKPKDFDVATSARPPDLRKLFRNCRIIGRRFRLAHMLFQGGKIIEVATFRRDPPESDDDDLLISRDNVFGEPFEDAMRRDFTINAMFYDVVRQEIIDYVGGLDDVERRLIRTIGDPDIRLQEDPVRILRAIRFTAKQDLGMDPELYRAARRHRALIVRSAPARVFEEILKLLRGGAAQRSIWLLREMGVLGELIPELDDVLSSGWGRARRTYAMLRGLDAMVWSGRRPADAVLIATLLEQPLLDFGDGIDQGRSVRDTLLPIAERLQVPRRIREELRQILVAQRRLADPSRRRGGRREHIPEAVDFHEISLRAAGRSELEVRALRADAVARASARPSHERSPRRRSRGGRRR
jgi:poly(A) polymerase